MTPTREQIKAAENAYDATFIRGTHASALAAALTAAAQVQPESTMEHIARDIREGRFPQKSDAAAQVEDTAVAVWMGKHSYATGHGDTIGDMLDELHAATIERCAQVAEKFDYGDQVAAAIRAMKEGE